MNKFLCIGQPASTVALVILTSISLTLFQGCGKKNEENKGAQNPGEGPSSAVIKKVSAWKDMPQKNCDAVEIFGNAEEVALIKKLQPKRVPGIDGTWLHNKLGGKLELINVGNGRTLHFGTPILQKASRSSYLGKYSGDSGAPQIISAQATSDGTFCDVLVNGVSLAKVPIYASLPLVEVTDAAKPIATGSVSERISQTSSYQKWTHRLYGIDAISRLISYSRQPNLADATWASEQLGLSIADKIITISSATESSGRLNGLYAFQNYPEIPPAISNKGNFFWTTAKEFSALVPTETTPSVFEIVRLAEPDFFPGVSPTEPASQKKFRQTKATIKVTAQKPTYSALDGWFELTALEEIPARVVSGAEEGAGCATAYLNRLLMPSPLDYPIGGSDAPTYEPKFSDVFGACMIMRPTLAADLVSTDAGKQVLQRIYGGRALDLARSSSWFQLLADSLYHAASVGTSSKLSTIIDPQNKIPVIQLVDTYLDDANAFMQNKPLQSLRKEVITLAINWALRFSKDDTGRKELQQVLAAAEVLQSDFPDAAKEFLLNAKENPSRTLKEMVPFVQKISESSKESSRKAMAAAKDFYELQEYLANRHKNLLAEKVSADQWRAIVATLNAVKEFLAREHQRLLKGAEVGTGSLFPFSKLFEFAFAKSWSQKQFEDIESMARLAVFDPTCRRTVIAVDAVSCLGINLVTEGGEHFFALGDAQRYSAIADSFVKTLTLLQNESFVGLRADLLKAFVAPVWKSCRGTQLSAKTENLMAISEKLALARLELQPDLESQLQESLKDCDM